MELLLDKFPVREKESAHLTFDLAVEEGGLRIDQGPNLMDPAKDALPGSCRDFVGVHSALDAVGPKGGVALGVLDSPLVELGTMVDERPNAAGIRHWKQEPYAGTDRARVPPQQLLAHELQGRPAGPAALPLRAPAARRRAGRAVMDLSRDLEQPLVVLPEGR